MNNYLSAMYNLHTSRKRLQWHSGKLSIFREKQLRRLVKYAYENVPFYHNKFRAMDLKPSDIEHLEDLGKLPVIQKSEVRKNLAEMVSQSADRGSLTQLSTSGSTGAPLILYIDKYEDILRKVRHLRANITCGQHMRDRWVTVTGSHINVDVGRLQQFLRIYLLRRVSVFLDVKSQVDIVAGLKPDVLEGYSSSLVLLAKEVDRLGLKTIMPRVMFSGAELVDDSSRKYVEDVFGAFLYDHYATIEFGKMAWQCSEKAGYHIDADALIMEFVDEHGDAVSSGESGEVVCTSLFNYSMPFIRYAVGDIGVPTDEECPCGRAFPLMKLLEGRRDSILVFPDGRQFSPRTFTVAVRMFELYNSIDQFRVVQKSQSLLEFLIKLKSADNIGRENFTERFVDHIKHVLKTDDSGVTIEVRFVDAIPLDKGGKLKTVVSELH
jgi:phenylacetate-CoA ligase